MATEKFGKRPMVFDDPPDKRFVRFSAFGSLAIMVVFLTLIAYVASNIYSILLALLLIIPIAFLPYLAVWHRENRGKPRRILVGNLGITLFYPKKNPIFISWWEIGGLFMPEEGRGFNLGLRPARGNPIYYPAKTGVIQEISIRYWTAVGEEPPKSIKPFTSPWVELSRPERDRPI